MKKSKNRTGLVMETIGEWMGNKKLESKHFVLKGRLHPVCVANGDQRLRGVTFVKTGSEDLKPQCQICTKHWFDMRGKNI